MFISFERTELVPYLPTITCGVNFSKTAAVMHFHFVTYVPPWEEKNMINHVYFFDCTK